MKILHAIDKMDPERGGVCQAVRTMVSGLAMYGVENHIVSLDSPEEPFLNEISCPVYALGPAEKYWSYSKKLIPWLKDNLSGYDVIIVHGLWQYPSYALNHVRELLRKEQALSMDSGKIFVMPHGMLDPYFQEAPGRKLKAIRNRIYWSVIEGKAVSSSDGLLFTCATERLLAKLPFKPYKPKKELVVGLGVEMPPPCTSEMTKAFNEVHNGVKEGDFLLFLSRLHEKKGIDILLEGYRRLQQASGKSGIAKLVIAGPGLETAYGRKIQRQISGDKFLRENVFLTGMLTGDAKWGAFYGCEAFILPSHQENFGIAIVEALACRKPVMISNKVNIWREIAAAQAGFIGYDTVEGVVDVFNRWKNCSENTRRQMGANAFKCFEENFSVKAASEKLLKELAQEKFMTLNAV